MIEVPAAPPPKINSFYEMKGEGLDNLPDGPMPYFVVAKDGMYVHRRNILGRGVGRLKVMPQHLGKVGNNGNGQFIWDAPEIPAIITAQIISFFRRIWEKYKTEAEVLLTMNIETKEWRVFVPTQKVSGTSVNSVHDPNHISKGYLVVGTMHSHCNFGAFHSGTDSADADDMDGVHFTVGHVDRDNPEVVAMVALGGAQFHYKPSSLGDFSDLAAGVAPEWWDEYVIPTNKLNEDWRPRGWDLFQKFTPSSRAETAKSTTTTTYTNPSYKPTERASYTDADWQSIWDDEDYGSAWWIPGGPKSYTDYLREQTEKHRKKDDEVPIIHGQTSDIPKERALVPVKPTVDDDDDAWVEYWQRASWEDDVPEELMEILLDSDLLTDDDEHNAIIDMRIEALDLVYWRRIYMDKIARGIRAMEKMGIYLDIGVKKDDSISLIELPVKKSRKKGTHV